MVTQTATPSVAAVSDSLCELFGFFIKRPVGGQLLVAYGHKRPHFPASTDAAHPSVMVATEPLGDVGAWTRFAPGELRLYQDGALLQQILTTI